MKLNTNAKMSILLALFVIGVTTFISIINAGFDPSKVDWGKWFVDIATNEAIAFVMMFLGEAFYMSFATGREDGKYQRALNDFNQKVAQVGKTTQYLGQYLNKRHASEVALADINYLKDHRIDNAINLLRLDLTEVKFLEKPYQKEIDGQTVCFKSYSKRQRKVIRFVLRGGVVVRKVPKIFYLDANNNLNGLSEYQQAGRITDEIRVTRHGGRVYKAVAMALLSAMAAGVTVSQIKDVSSVETWFILVSRLSAAIGGFYAGCRNSFAVNEIQCRALALKTNMLKDYELYLEANPNEFTIPDEEAEAQEACQVSEKLKGKEALNGQNHSNKRFDID